MSPLTQPNDQYAHFSRYVPTGLMEIRVNISNCERVLAGDYPCRILAVTTIQAPDEHGLPINAEYDLLVESERSFLARLESRGSELLYIGHILHQGSHVVVLHGADATAVDDQDAIVIRDGRRQWDVYTSADPMGRFITLKMMPLREELRRVRDGEVLAALAAANDIPTVPRLLTFYALFRTEAEADGAAALLDQNQFTASPVSQMPGSGDYKWSLMFSCVAPTEPEVIEQISALADSICAQFGGQYDGWSADPMSAG
jgi:hypothetical protein